MGYPHREHSNMCTSNAIYEATDIEDVDALIACSGDRKLIGNICCIEPGGASRASPAIGKIVTSIGKGHSLVNQKKTPTVVGVLARMVDVVVVQSVVQRAECKAQELVGVRPPWATSSVCSSQAVGHGGTAAKPCHPRSLQTIRGGLVLACRPEAGEL